MDELVATLLADQREMLLALKAEVESLKKALDYQTSRVNSLTYWSN